MQADSITTEVKKFQSTLPREERRRSQSRSKKQTDFNPRSHERSDGDVVVVFLTSQPFQSTLPREERHRQRSAGQQQTISIHAPTRGATAAAKKTLKTEPISIHAPTRGATMYSQELAYTTFYFNPRSHERSDYAYHLQLTIHQYFNPRSHERSDSLLPHTR